MNSQSFHTNFIFISYSGKSPASLTLERLKENGISIDKGHHKIPNESPFSVNVPGAPAAWYDTVQTFGSKKVWNRK